jgi:hypothetical protein
MNSKTFTDKYLIKGTGIRNFKKYIENEVNNDYFDELTEAVDFGPKNLILSSQWYPANLLIEMIELTSLRLNKSLEQITREAAKFSLEEDLNGIYKFFMRVGGSRLVLSKLPTLSKTYTDFITAEIIHNETGNLVIIYTLPEEISDWLSWYLSTVEGAIEGMLSVCGNSLNSFKILSKHSTEDKLKLTVEVNYSSYGT